MAAAMASRERSIAPSTERSASSDWGGILPPVRPSSLSKGRRGSAIRSAACSIGIPSARRASLQGVAHTLHVLPRLALQAGIAKERRGVIRRDERNASILERASAQGGHRGLRLQESLHRGEAQRADERGPHERELLLEVGQALLHLVRHGRPVLRRPALEHVADEDLLAPKLNGGDHLVEELTRASDEGDAFEIFVPPRRLSDEHELRPRAAVGEDRVRACLAQAALATLR